jgi:hypothetical protein
MLKPTMHLADPGATLSENKFGSNKFLTLGTIALAVGSIAMLIGLLVLIGWTLNLEELGVFRQ